MTNHQPLLTEQLPIFERVAARCATHSLTGRTWNISSAHGCRRSHGFLSSHPGRLESVLRIARWMSDRKNSSVKAPTARLLPMVS